MTVFKVTRSRRAQRPLVLRHTGIGLLLGAVAAFTAVHATEPMVGPSGLATFAIGQVAPVSSLDPSKQVAGTISVSNIDFKRGDGGAGRLILSFSGEGAAPDLRNQGSKVVINVANASLPASLQRPLNVSDFATPVGHIEARSSGAGTTLVLSTEGAFESMAYQTGKDYIVEIVPRAAVAKTGSDKRGSVAMGATSAANTTSAKAYGGRPVTFNFQDVPVRTVLQLVAEESNLNIVAADTVQGNVTLRLINVPWDQALDIVLQAKGLDKRRSGNVIWVAPQAELAQHEQAREDARIAMSNRVELTTEYIQINYHNAGQIYKALTEAKGVGGSGGGGGGGSGGGSSNTDTGFLSPRGRLVADDRTNTLMISDTPKKVAEMKELIAVIDRPVDQVVIEARVVIATESFSRELGAKFGISGSKDNAYFSGDLGTNHTNRTADVTADRTNRNAIYQNDLANANRNRDYVIENLERASQGLPALPPPVSTLPQLIGSTITSGLMSNLGASPAGAVALSILNAGYLLDIELSAMQTQGRGEVISN
ncbi:MAG: type IV pilus secretin PilQ, partial [Lysobacter sp.]